MKELVLYDLGIALPTCALCNKPVDRVESMYLPDYDGKLFRVYCHGQMEQQILGSFTMQDAKEITFGKAFNAPRLENKND